MVCGGDLRILFYGVRQRGSVVSTFTWDGYDPSYACGHKVLNALKYIPSGQLGQHVNLREIPLNTH